MRAATLRDAADIARIYNHHVDEGTSTFDMEPWTLEWTTQLLDFEQPDGWYVAEQEGVVTGWASVRRYSMRFGYRFSSETSIYLDSAAMGCGVSDALQVRIEEHCRECGIHHAMAKIIADNDRSIAFHRRHGYEVVGIQKEIGHMNGAWCDVAILQKIF